MSTGPTLRIGSLAIPPAEQTPLVLALVEIFRRQDAEIKALRERTHSQMSLVTAHEMRLSMMEDERPHNNHSSHHGDT